MQIRMTVSQRSRITGEDGETAELSSLSPGCLRDGTLTYTETTDGAKVYYRVTADSEDTLTVSRSGAIVSEIVFRAGERYTSVYRIPPYAFDMTVETESLSVKWEGAGIEIAVVFRSTLGGSSQRTEMTITATPREEAPS